jgi:hypothetical protein
MLLYGEIECGVTVCNRSQCIILYTIPLIIFLKVNNLIHEKKQKNLCIENKYLMTQ